MSVLVDDNDLSVQYNSHSGWEKHGQAPEFNATTHASATRGDTATLEFQGTSISIYGSLGPSAPGARLNFSLDGLDAGSFVGNGTPQAQHNQLFWTSSTVQEASHTLVVTVDHDTATPQVNLLNRTFFLDYFIYNTSAVNAPGTTEFIDDTDTKVIYSDHWNAANNSDGSLQGTFHTNKVPGAWAAIKFQGTAISLFGKAKGPLSYVIDSSPPVTTSIPSKTGGQIFHLNELVSSPHTLNITFLYPGDLAIDGFFVAPVGDTPPVAGTSSSSTTVVTQAATAASSSAGASFSSKRPPIGAIVGGAAGGVVLLLLLLFGILFRRRWRARTTQPAFEYPTMSQQPLPDPWAHKRVSMSSLTTLTEDTTSPKNFGKPRPPSRYIYYES
ncbi:parallel beta-helix repeat protein [Favolaschia claudopus]|uniref:Parallel beta-helix repeat protein n=1 Tax=Favolaschia claudopus TaxID=2862362 RepID=A0AAW0AX80_9AGAR